MKKLILIAAVLMLLSVSLMGITFKIEVINAKPNTQVYISGHTGTPAPGPWTEWDHALMTQEGPNGTGNGYIYSISAPSNGHNGFNVTAYAGNQSSHREGSQYLYGSLIWLPTITLTDKKPIADPTPIQY